MLACLVGIKDWSAHSFRDHAREQNFALRVLEVTPFPNSNLAFIVELKEIGARSAPETFPGVFGCFGSDAREILKAPNK